MIKFEILRSSSSQSFVSRKQKHHELVALDGFKPFPDLLSYDSVRPRQGVLYLSI